MIFEERTSNQGFNKKCKLRPKGNKDPREYNIYRNHPKPVNNQSIIYEVLSQTSTTFDSLSFLVSTALLYPFCRKFPVASCSRNLSSRDFPFDPWNWIISQWRWCHRTRHPVRAKTFVCLHSCSKNLIDHLLSSTTVLFCYNFYILNKIMNIDEPCMYLSTSL